MELMPQGEDELDPADKTQEERIEERDSIFSPGYLQRYANQRRPSRKLVSNFLRSGGRSQSPSPAQSNQPAVALILVFHGGTVLDVSPELANKAADVATLRSNLEAVSRQHFAGLGRLAVRLVSCPTLCPDAITVLNSLSFSEETAEPSSSPSSSWPPLGCLPLFAASSPEYADTVSRAVVAANQAYAEFLKSPEGAGFSGTVAVVGDAAGSVLLYDALCKAEPDLHSHFGSENSIAEDADLLPVEEEVERADHFRFSAGSSSSFRRSAHLQPHRRPSTTSSDLTGPRSKHFLDFDVGDCFLLGSPLALVLAFRK